MRSSSAAHVSESRAAGLLSLFNEVRRRTEEICAPLEIEDHVVQPSTDVSPPKWHLGHTTWFFETVVLLHFQKQRPVFHPTYNFIFNSYYEALNPRIARCDRGTLARPTVREIMFYRRVIDDDVRELLANATPEQWPELFRLVTIGLQHEEQHQELLLTDIKFIFARNPSRPLYRVRIGDRPKAIYPAQPVFHEYMGGMATLGAQEDGFAWDNEKPAHQVFLKDFKIGTHLVINGEFLEFIEAGGYNDYRWWLSDGWEWRTKENWQAPLYWEKDGSDWSAMTLHGMESVNPREPVCHVSFFEADAFARWKKKRLPTEAEWEHAARLSEAEHLEANFYDSHQLQPVECLACGHNGAHPLHQMFGDVWEWTQSPYLPYPGFKPDPGLLSEYNGKFMSNQMVLRGGSCATPTDHMRISYRNFFQPEKRWQFSGFRLAED